MPSVIQKARENASKPYIIISGGCLIIGIILIIIGAVLLKPTTKTVSQYQEIDYTHCLSFPHLILDKSVECLEYRKTNEECVCQPVFNITETLMGDNIILYYELDTYDQTVSSYKNSRDDLQLSGHLSPKPSEQCGSYSYDGTKPIAPCGELADRMFTDNFYIRKDKETIFFNVTSHGMITDKGIFRNPKRNESETLEQAFKDFAKPKNWTKNIWELDTENEDNNGFENERFIGWMNTAMKRKPYFRLKQNKLEEGIYALRVDYNYPPTLYNGTRKAILVASSTITDNSSYGGGVACLVIGLLLMAALFAYILYWRHKHQGDMGVFSEAKPLRGSGREPQIVPPVSST